MEIISRLIQQLQADNQTEPNLDRMIETTRHLYEELLLLRRAHVNENREPERKVSVILPGWHPLPSQASPETAPAKQAEPEAARAVPGEPLKVAATASQSGSRPQPGPAAPRESPIRVAAEAGLPLPEQQTASPKEHLDRAAALRSRQEHLSQILQQQQPAKSPARSVREINESVAQSSPSLNERLKSSQVDLGAKLSSGGISDLRQALGLNDRFLYINELFRGDQDMFERSMITINNARSLNEARYWIERELKIKLGWLEDHPLVQQFYELVSKRFS